MPHGSFCREWDHAVKICSRNGRAEGDRPNNPWPEILAIVERETGDTGATLLDVGQTIHDLKKATGMVGRRGTASNNPWPEILAGAEVRPFLAVVELGPRQGSFCREWANVGKF